MGKILCPLLPCLALRPKHCNGPPFILKDGRGLIHQHFNSILDTLLSRLGFDRTQYNTHSFHIGVANVAAQANIPYESIPILGRWKSNAYHIIGIIRRRKVLRIAFFAIVREKTFAIQAISYIKISAEINSVRKHLRMLPDSKNLQNFSSADDSHYMVSAVH